MHKHLIVAISHPQSLIGSNNSIPWNFPEDLSHFKNITIGHICIMGYNTHLSLKKPLINRINIVINRNVHGIIFENGFYFVNNLSSAINYSQEMFNASHIFIIGGSQLYKESLQSIHFDSLLITRLNIQIPSNSLINPIYFPWDNSQISSKYHKIEEKISQKHPNEIIYEKWIPI